MVTWKDKILDYEIETWCKTNNQCWYVSLEKIRFSITRLKLWNGFCSFTEFFTWKDKILDYEIETSLFQKQSCSTPFAWKDKILDYEIETMPSLIHLIMKCNEDTWKDKILDYEIETG